LCEEFQKLPTEIVAEQAQLPAGFLEEIIEARAYAATKLAYDRQQDPKAEHPLVALVKLIEVELVQEELARVADVHRND